jgi:hypothetical protein
MLTEQVVARENKRYRLGMASSHNVVEESFPEAGAEVIRAHLEVESISNLSVRYPMTRSGGQKYYTCQDLCAG